MSLHATTAAQTEVLGKAPDNLAMKRTIKTLMLLLRVALGVGLLYYVLTKTGSWRFFEQLMASPRLAVLVALCTCIGATVEARRLALLLRSQGIELPLLRGLRLISIATFFSLFIPGGTGGDVAKLYALAGRRPGRRVEVALVVLVDRAMGLLSLVTLVTVFGLASWPLPRQRALIGYLVGAAFCIGTALVSAVALGSSERLHASSVYAWVRTRLPGRRYLVRVWDALYAFRSHRAALVGAWGLSLIGHTALCGLFIVVGAQAVAAAPVPHVCLLGLLGMLANVLPLTPAGIGVGEGAAAGLFALAGYRGGSELILAWRAGSLLLSVVGAVLWLPGFKHTPQPHASPLRGEAPP